MSASSGYPNLFPPSTIFPPSTLGAAPTAPPRTVRDLVAAVYRQVPLIAGCTLLATVLALGLYRMQPKVYASTAKVWVQTEQQGSPSFLSGIAAYRETPYPDPVNRKIETEIELMLTRTNAQKVVEKLGITDAQLARGSFSRVRAAMGGGASSASSSASGASPAEGAEGARTVDLFLDGVSIEPLRSKTADTTSNVLEVKFECTDPQLAPVALQAFLDNYLQLGAQQNRRLGETTSRLIESKLAQAKDELRQSEDAIVALLVKDSGRTAAIDLPRGVASPSATTATSSQGAYATATPAGGSLRLDPNPELTMGTPQQAVAALKSQTLDLQLRLDEARQQFTDDTEPVRNLRERLDTTRKRLVTTVRENTQLEAQLNRLERQRALAQDRYVELQKKLDQIDLYLKLNPTEAESRVVIDAPYHPADNEGKRKPLIALLGPVAGFLLGLLLSGLREFGGDRLRTPREVEWALGAPVIGALPTLSGKARHALLGPAFDRQPSVLES